jgi:hypothetical protein
VPEAVLVSKDPEKVRAGKLGAESRWHQPKVVDLGELSPPQRRLVLALVDAARSEKAAPGEAAPEAATRGDGVDDQNLAA